MLPFPGSLSGWQITYHIRQRPCQQTHPHPAFSFTPWDPSPSGSSRMASLCVGQGRQDGSCSPLGLSFFSSLSRLALLRGMLFARTRTVVWWEWGWGRGRCSGACAALERRDSASCSAEGWAQPQRGEKAASAGHTGSRGLAGFQSSALTLMPPPSHGSQSSQPGPWH